MKTDAFSSDDNSFDRASISYVSTTVFCPWCSNVQAKRYRPNDVTITSLIWPPSRGESTVELGSFCRQPSSRPDIWNYQRPTHVSKFRLWMTNYLSGACQTSKREIFSQFLLISMSVNFDQFYINVTWMLQVSFRIISDISENINIQFLVNFS